MNFKKINHIKTKLSNECLDLDVLVQLANIVARVSSSDIDDLFAQFHNHAGRFPYVDDEDVGAVILQLTAFKTNDIGLKKRLFKEAVRRAGWCAQCATSGGEGESRKQHLFELLNQLKQYQGCSICNIYNGEFESESDYLLVEKKVSKLIADKKLKRILDRDAKKYFFEETYQCEMCQQQWVFSRPDQAYRGGWMVVENGL